MVNPRRLSCHLEDHIRFLTGNVTDSKTTILPVLAGAMGLAALALGSAELTIKMHSLILLLLFKIIAHLFLTMWGLCCCGAFL